jgi:hypothetical protein
MPNHEDVGCSEHQIRLSKGVIAKFVQSLKLTPRFGRQTQKATAMVAFCVLLPYVTGTVSSFRVANRVGGNGRFLRGFPMWELPRGSMHEELSAGHEVSLTRSRPLAYMSFNTKF